MKSYDILKVKNALIKCVCVPRHGIHYLQSVVTETECVYCTVRTESLIQGEFDFQTISSHKDTNVSN